MNRLNLAQMVNKSLLGQQENKFFNVALINSEDYFESEKYAAKIKQTKERLNLDKRIYNIVFNAHEKLKEQKYYPHSLKTKPKPQPTKPKLKENLEYKKQSSPIKEEEKRENIINSLENIECQNINLPRMKVLCCDKHNERVHKATETTSNYISYEDHRRMMSSVQRQNEVENMIKEHKLLIEDRRSLEQDIFAMRHSLDDLHHRINNSIKQLTNKKTYCECHGLKKSKSCKKCNDSNINPQEYLIAK